MSTLEILLLFLDKHCYSQNLVLYNLDKHCYSQNLVLYNLDKHCYSQNLVLYNLGKNIFMYIKFRPTIFFTRNTGIFYFGQHKTQDCSLLILWQLTWFTKIIKYMYNCIITSGIKHHKPNRISMINMI